MRYILHYTDLYPHSSEYKDGIFVHLEYNFNKNSEPFVEKFMLCNIINGELGQEIQVSTVLKMSIIMKLAPLMVKCDK